MPAIHITKALLANMPVLPEGKVKVRVFDTRTKVFIAEIRRGGALVLLYFGYTDPRGRQREIKLGRLGDVSLDQARKRAELLKAETSLEPIRWPRRPSGKQFRPWKPSSATAICRTAGTITATTAPSPPTAAASSPPSAAGRLTRSPRRPSPPSASGCSTSGCRMGSRTATPASIGTSAACATCWPWPAAGSCATDPILRPRPACCRRGTATASRPTPRPAPWWPPSTASQ